MANPDRLMAAGLSPDLAEMLGQLTATGLTATGTTLATGFPLITQNAKFSTVASNTGCVLPSSMAQPQFTIYNGGANALKVYPISTQTINGLSAGLPYSLLAGEAATFTPADNVGWVAVSASNSGAGAFTSLTATTATIDALTVNSIAGGDSSLGITGLAPTASVAGGGIIVTSGAGANVATLAGNGAALSFSAGASGNAATGSGGALQMTAGNALSTDGAGGALTLIAGAGTGIQNGGDLNLRSGAAGGSGVAGSITFQGDANIIFPTYQFTGTPAATDAVFFVATRPMVVKSVSQVHSVAAGGTSTLTVIKDTGTAAPGAGTVIQTGSFNLNATANTVQSGTLAAAAATLTMAAGDRLSVKFANAIQSSAGIVVTVGLMPA